MPDRLKGTLDCWKEDVKLDVRKSSDDDWIEVESINPESSESATKDMDMVRTNGTVGP